MNWNEICAELAPGQDVRDRPDLVDRVFGLKLDDLLGDLTVNGVLGKCRAVASVIECQNRGNIHCHIVLWTENHDDLLLPGYIDSVVSAEIPDPVAEPDLHALVTGNMMQGSCSPQENKPCLRLGKDGKYRCRFAFPRQQCNLTSLDPRSGYPIYRRRCLHQTVKKNRPLSDQWVATYSPFLLLKYRAHINVEVCSNDSIVKYIIKYINKGQDMATLGVTDGDEIGAYQNSLYIGPHDAFWRIMAKRTYFKRPFVCRLPFHEPGHQCVTWDANSTPEELRDRADSTKSMLMAWFEFNDKHPDGDQRRLLYTEFPQWYVWKRNQQKWKRRSRGKVIGRMYVAFPSQGERYYIRLLLTQRPGMRSFEDLRTVDGHLCHTFRDAASRLGLLQDDRQWVCMFRDLSPFRTAHVIRNFFVILLMHESIEDPTALWLRIAPSLSDDLVTRLSHIPPHLPFPE